MNTISTDNPPKDTQCIRRSIKPVNIRNTMRISKEALRALGSTLQRGVITQAARNVSKSKSSAHKLFQGEFNKKYDSKGNEYCEVSQDMMKLVNEAIRLRDEIALKEEEKSKAAEKAILDNVRRFKGSSKKLTEKKSA